MTKLRSYPSIYNMGHRALTTLFDKPVIIQEKVDGSQFSFGIEDGELFMRSKGAEVFAANPEALFKLAVDAVVGVRARLHEGWVYRGEYLSKPKHNTLKYDTIPGNNIVLFDIDIGEENPMAYGDVAIQAQYLGFDVVPRFFEGMWTGGADGLREYLETESFLGGCKVEGIVIKSFDQFGPDNKRLMGKFVSEAFKETHTKEWKKSNPKQNDIIINLIERNTTDARWAKAVQHLREAGQLEDSPKDIPLLMKEVGLDILKESKDDIMEDLWKWAWPQLQRGVTKGLPEWYKQRLLDAQFEQEV